MDTNSLAYIKWECSKLLLELSRNKEALSKPL